MWSVWSYIGCLLWLQLFSFAVAFLPSSPRRPLLTLKSSTDGLDDELSKLIGKRNKIQRKRKETSEESEINISMDDIDLDKMPEFTTKRPTRQPKPKEDEDDKPKNDKEDLLFVDYQSEYNDENDFHIPNRIGFSTRPWGDPKLGFVEGGKLSKRLRRQGKFVPGDLQVAYNELMEAGICFIYTNESHGKASRSKKLSAHDILARCMTENADSEPLVLTGKPWSFQSMSKSLETSCSRLGVSNVEVFQVPVTRLLSSLLASKLQAASDSGSTNHVGICTKSAFTVKTMARSLEKRGVTLTSNTFEFSLTNRKLEGLLEACKERGVIPLCLNPLDDGLASGKYTATNPSGGEATGSTKFSFKELEKLQPLHSMLETVAERCRTRVERELRDLKDRYKGRYGPQPSINTDITTAQVAINYVIAKGGVPLPEIRNPSEAEELKGCLGWSLAEDEVDMLDSAADLCNL